MSAKLLVYGANGFVGESVARAARAFGVPAVVAGRNAWKLRPLAAELNDFPHCALLFASPQDLWDLSCRRDWRARSASPTRDASRRRSRDSPSC